jgi:DNA invertase Pin-like site-specific DNA recombinase
VKFKAGAFLLFLLGRLMGSGHFRTRGNKMDTERKEIRNFIKQSLRDNFEKILYDAKMSDEETDIVRMVILKKASTVKTAMTLNVSESTVYRVMRDFYDRTQAILIKSCRDIH